MNEMTDGRYAEDVPSDLDFTYWARERFYDVADDPYFQRGDPQLIYDALKERMRMVPFGDFLKRYIFEKAGMSGRYSQVPIKQYVDTLCAEFEDRQTPCSFRPTSVRLRNAARNWLEQKTVSRSVVLLLGFGLGMSADDVNGFLTKALQEPGLNARDPFEAICWYCYRKGRGFGCFDELWAACQDGSVRETLAAPPAPDSTAACGQLLSRVESEGELMGYLAGLPIAKGTRRQSVSARKAFDALYGEACGHVARILTESSKDDAGIAARRLEEALSRDDRIWEEQRRARVSRAREGYTAYRAEEITPADLESVLFAAVPTDRHGNLIPVKSSELCEQFAGRRLSRQRVAEILSGDAPITRYDLITLNFFNCSQRDTAKTRQRYADFIASSNAMLKGCAMGPVYVVNPYECFLLMCMLTEDPLGTFADIWERSFGGE